MTEVIETETEDQIREHHRKKLLELSLKLSGKKPQIEDPTEDQKRWVLKKLKRGMSI